MENTQTHPRYRPRSPAVPIMQTHRDDKSRRAITIEGRSPSEVFRFWRDFQNLPHFMKGVSSIDNLAAGQTHWLVEMPSGLRATWNAEITDEEPGVMLAWRSLPDSQVRTSGSAWFTATPDGQGTIVTLSMDYEIMGGRMSELATFLMGEDPDTLVRTNLHRLKAYLETGEIPTIEGQPSGREELKPGKETQQ